MIVRSLKISNERILKIIADLGYEKIPTNMYEKLGMFIVDLAKDHMQHKFEVDHLNPKDNKIMLSTTRTKIIKKIINSVTYVLKEDELLCSTNLSENSLSFSVPSISSIMFGFVQSI